MLNLNNPILSDRRKRSVGSVKSLLLSVSERRDTEKSEQKSVFCYTRASIYIPYIIYPPIPYTEDASDYYGCARQRRRADNDRASGSGCYAEGVGGKAEGA